MKRQIILTLATLLLLLALPLAGGYWLLHSESGLQWVHSTLQRAFPDSLKIGRIEGLLAGPLRLSNVEYRDEQVRMQVADLRLHWTPLGLLAGRVQVERLQISGPTIELLDTTAQTGPSSGLPELALPLAIELQTLEIDDLTIRRAEFEQKIRRISAGVQINDRGIGIRQAEILADEFELRVDGSLGGDSQLQHVLTTDWVVRLPSDDILKGGGTLEGNLMETALEQTLRAPTRVRLKGVVKNLLDLPAWQAQVAIEDFDSAQWRYPMPAFQAVTNLTTQGTRADFSVEGQGEFNHPQSGELDAHYNFRVQDLGRVEVIDLALSQADLKREIKATGDWIPAADGGRVNLQLDWSGLRWPLQGEAELISARGQGSIHGSLDDYRFTLNTTRPLQDLPRSDWLVKGKGDLRRLELERLKIDTDDGSIQGQGRIELADLPQWQARLELDWNNQRYPFSGEPIVYSKRGQGYVEGNLDAYRFELRTSNPLPQLPASEWFARGSGNLLGADFDKLQINALDGVINARGALDWSERLSWQAEVEAAELNPAGLYPDWPGRLQVGLRTTGYLQDERVTSETEIERIEGRLRDYPVVLDAGIGLQQTGEGYAIDIRQLTFQSGQSTLTAAGRAGQKLALDWSLDSPDLAQLLPRAGGRLRAEGSLKGTFEQPQIVADLEASRIAYDAYQAAKIKGRLTLDMLDLARFEVDLEATSLLLEEQQVDRIAVRGNPRELAIQAEAGNYAAEIELAGRADGMNWRGRVRKANLTLGPFQDWRLEAEPVLTINGEQLDLQRSCWLGRGGERLCAALSGGGRLWSSKLQASDLPLQRLQQWLPVDLELEGVADADADLEYRDDRLFGRVDITLPGGELRYPLLDGEIEQWRYNTGSIALVADREGIRSVSELRLDNDGRMFAEIELPGAVLPVLDFEKQPLSGVVKMNIDDLAFAGLWLPEVHDVKGRVDLQMKLGGQLARPRLDGQINLAGASFAIPRLGLKISEVEFRGQSQGFERLDFQVAAKSGEGRLDIDGELSLNGSDSWQTRMTVRGNNLEVSRIPEAQVQASPDLVLTVRPYHIEVEGTVVIPYAHIEPRDFSTAARVSSDVVMVGEEQQQAKQWTVVSRVQLQLGERVHFFGFGFEGRLAGGLLIEESPGQPARATGQIDIQDGRYRAYGQRLDIEQGRIIFSGGPLISPGLDVRAVRRINTITVGIQALGTINDPKIELFSTPAMGQTDILSYLILGRPLENASSEEGQMMARAALALGLAGGDRLARNLRERFGLDEMRIESSDQGDQASLVIGRYLTPRLYVSYGIGLIEAFNTFIVRYQITERWQLKAESGESHGADLIYTIER